MTWPGARRPFRLRPQAVQARRVAVALERPGVDDLAAALDDPAERQVGTARFEAGFLDELADGGLERIFARMDAALRNRPRAFVSRGPERPAGMREQDLEAVTGRCRTVRRYSTSPALSFAAIARTVPKKTSGVILRKTKKDVRLRFFEKTKKDSRRLFRRYPTWTRGRRSGFGSALRSTSRVTGAVSPSPNARNFSR